MHATKDTGFCLNFSIEKKEHGQCSARSGGANCGGGAERV